MVKLANPDALKGQGLSSRAIRFASLILVVITIVGLAAVAYFTERGIVASRDSVIHTYQVQTQLNDLQLEFMRAQADDAVYLLTQRKSNLPQAKQQGEMARQSLGVLRRLTRDNPRQQARLDELTPVLNQALTLMEERPNPGDIRIKLAPAAERRQFEIENYDTRINSVIESMRQEEQILLAQRLKDWNYLLHRNIIMLAIAFAIVTLMLGYNFWLLITQVAEAKDREDREQANARSYRLMSARILELQDAERRRIARELHDSVGQFLAGLKINLNQLENGNRVDAPAMLHQTIELTDCAIQEVRTISHLLHPPLLEELGFLSAARWYVDEYGKRGQVKVSLAIDEPIKRLPRDIEIALFRVLQEALTNVYRHAAAQAVDIRIACREGEVHLTVADDGKGIPHEVLSRFYEGAAPGIGLAGMRERLAEFGGQMRVHSSSAGSVVEATIPTQNGSHRQSHPD